MANTYSDSFGNRWTTAQIDRNSANVAKELLDEMESEYGYLFCSRCKKNSCKPIDVSHTVSRKYAKENSCVEILWTKSNLEILGRDCHAKKDGLDLKFTNDYGFK